MKKLWKIVLLLAAVVMLLSVTAYAQDYTKKGTFYWVKKDGLFYAYDAQTHELICNQKVGKCRTNEDGTRYVNEFVDGIFYNAKGLQRKQFKGGWVKSGDQYFYFNNQKKLTGYRKINGKRYFFGNDGVRMTGIFYANGKYRMFAANGQQVETKGWKKINSKKYYVNASGVIPEGFITINKKKYYQTALDGIATGEKTIDGVKYYFKANGVYDESTTESLRKSGTGALGNPADLLFFTKFESGDAAYDQCGGDHGHACGKYQFDNRYSLQNLLNYCHTANPTFFKDFEPFLTCSKDSLVNNNKLYKAWHACYAANPQYFASMQDNFAADQYYKPVETALLARGYNLTLRPYVCRGAVFSYSIQEGQTVAVNAVIAAGCKDSISNKEFLEKLYDYRWKDPKGWGKNSDFSYRYQTEKALALSLLGKL